MSDYLQTQIIHTQSGIRANNDLLKFWSGMTPTDQDRKRIEDNVESLNQRAKVLDAHLAVLQSQARPKDI